MSSFSSSANRLEQPTSAAYKYRRAVPFSPTHHQSLELFLSLLPCPAAAYRRPISFTIVSQPKPSRHRLCLGEMNPFYSFPFSFIHHHKPSPPPSMPAMVELLPSPFRPSHSPP
uniref:Uncharacterized protein n=1 Tax=Oryza glumipatula TaxID=40148 RepID=A0A0E0B9C7_9ORYZ